jgi:hypothetical protein
MFSSQTGHSHQGIATQMNHRQRQRYLKVGGVVAFILLVIFLLSPGERGVVEKYVGGMRL